MIDHAIRARSEAERITPRLRGPIPARGAIYAQGVETGGARLLLNQLFGATAAPSVR